MLKTFIAAIAALFISSAATAETFVADPERTLYVVGQIGGGIMESVQRIEQMVESSTDPITLVINSPGGAVYPGIQVVSVMRVAQARGVKFRCFVPVMAASMAFQIFVTCDERYALAQSLLLWHPMKSGFRDGASSEEMLYNGRRLRALEKPFIRDLLKALKITPKKFFYHRRHETLWTGEEFIKMSPGFLTLVQDFKGVRGAYNLNSARD